MSKKGHFPGGHTVIRGPAPSSKERRTRLGALTDFPIKGPTHNLLGPNKKPKRVPYGSIGDRDGPASSHSLRIVHQIWMLKAIMPA